jgi:hypothetical protein
MYLGISVENFITIGIMLLIWMLTLHLIGQFGLQIPGLSSLTGG